MTRIELKQNAKSLLKNLDGKYQLFLFPILLTLFSGGLSIQQSFSSEQTNLSLSISMIAFPWVIQLLAAFFSVSAKVTMLEVLRFKKSSVTMSDSVRTFSTEWFRKLIALFIVRFLLITLWSLPTLAGFILAAFVINGKTTLNLQDGLLVLLAVLLYLLGTILSVIKSFAYSQAEFVLYDQLEKGETSSSLNILKTSAKVMKGNKFKLFILEISFIGWYLLIPFTLGLITIYLLPYLYTARASFYNQISDQN